MEIGLCMTVKNERHNLKACLEPIFDLFAQVVITDTGSSDGTPERIPILSMRCAEAGLLKGECCRPGAASTHGVRTARFYPTHLVWYCVPGVEPVPPGAGLERPMRRERI